MKQGNSKLSSFAEKDSCSIHLFGTLVPQERLYHIYCVDFTPVMFINSSCLSAEQERRGDNPFGMDQSS
jgi:hypothetical protein